MLENIFTKVDLLDFSKSLPKGRGASAGAAKSSPFHKGEVDDAADGIFSSILQGGINDAEEIHPPKNTGFFPDKADRTEAIRIVMRQKETTVADESGETIENGVVLAVKSFVPATVNTFSAATDDDVAVKTGLHSKNRGTKEAVTSQKVEGLSPNMALETDRPEAKNGGNIGLAEESPEKHLNSARSGEPFYSTNGSVGADVFPGLSLAAISSEPNDSQAVLSGIDKKAENFVHKSLEMFSLSGQDGSVTVKADSGVRDADKANRGCDLPLGKVFPEFTGGGVQAKSEGDEIKIIIPAIAADLNAGDENVQIFREPKAAKDAQTAYFMEKLLFAPKGAAEADAAAVYGGDHTAAEKLLGNTDSKSLWHNYSDIQLLHADLEFLDNSGKWRGEIVPSLRGQKDRFTMQQDEVPEKLLKNDVVNTAACQTGQHVSTLDNSLTVDNRNLAGQVMNQLPENALRKDNRVWINLYPESLGKLDMEIVIRENRVHVFIVAERPDVAQALHGQQEQLKNSLQSHGLQVGGLDFQWRENSSPMDDGTRSGSFWHQQNKERSHREENHGDTPVPAVNIGALTGNIMRIKQSERTISLFV